MKYFEILYHNWHGDKYVALRYGKTIEDTKRNFPTSHGCKLLDIKETTFEDYRTNRIRFFTQYNFS